MNPISSDNGGATARHALTTVSWQGVPAVHLQCGAGSILVTLFGAQVMSWVPADGIERLWQSPTPRSSLPAGTPIRGGIPLCWPWFARQNRSASDPQHGLLRNAHWACGATQMQADGSVALSFTPEPWSAAQRAILGPYEDLQVKLLIQLADSLTMRLISHHSGNAPLTLTQAFHSYFAVDDVARVKLTGLANTTYLDKRAEFARFTQVGEPTLQEPVDRIYEHTAGQYSLRRASSPGGFSVRSPGSRTAVLWNPGEVDARSFADVPGDSWRQFVCLEVAHASAGSLQLEPGQQVELVQELKPLL